MPGLAPKSGWNAIRTEPFDFLLHYSNCASVGTVELQKVHLYSRAALRLQPRQVLALASANAGTHQLLDRAGAGTCARRQGELGLAGMVLIGNNEYVIIYNNYVITV